MKTSKCPAKIPERHSVPPRPLANLPGLVKRSFVALRDYNPFTSSTSSRPDLEIPLAAGEMVTVVGDVDANGYYTVEKGGIGWEIYGLTPWLTSGDKVTSQNPLNPYSA